MLLFVLFRFFLHLVKFFGVLDDAGIVSCLTGAAEHTKVKENHHDADDENEKGGLYVISREEDGTDAKKSGNGVENENGSSLGKSHINEFVMKMAAIGRKRTFSLAESADNGNEGIAGGKSQNEEGNEKRNQRVEFKHTENGDGRQRVTEDQCARIAHKHFCGVEIKGKKAETRACKQKGKQGDVTHRGADDGGENKTERGNYGDAAGKSVQAVNQVDGVGNAHDPNNGKGNADPGGEGIIFAHHQKGIDPCSHQNGEEGCKDLS